MTQPLNDRVPIINADGTPTQFFIRQLQERGITLDGKITAEEAIELIEEWAAARDINVTAPITGGGPLSSDVNIGLANSGVTPGSYTNTDLTVDAFGRITAAVNGSGGGGGGLIVSHLYGATTSMTATGTQFAGVRIVPYQAMTITGLAYTALKAVSGTQSLVLRLVTLSNASGAGTVSTILASTTGQTLTGTGNLFTGGIASITPTLITPGAANYAILAESTATDSMRIGLTNANTFFAGLPCIAPAGFAGTVAVAPGAGFLNSASPYTLGLVV